MISEYIAVSFALATLGVCVIAGRQLFHLAVYLAKPEPDIALPPRDFHPQEEPHHVGGLLRFTTGANQGLAAPCHKGRYVWFGEGV